MRVVVVASGIYSRASVSVGVGAHRFGGFKDSGLIRRWRSLARVV